MTWAVIVALAVGTLLFKTLGPLVAGGVEPPARLTRVIELLTPALLASLIVVGTLGEGRHLVFDARIVGVLFGALLLLVRAPLLIALMGAAAVTAGVQALG